MTRTQNPLSLEYVLLGFLDQEPIHGYDLYKKLGEMDGIALVWRIKQSHLYALLDKLEKDGMVSSRTVPGENFPARREFQITDQGKKNFLAWLTTPVLHGRDMRQEFLAKLYFAYSARGDIFKNLISAQLEVCSKWMTTLKNDLGKLNSQDSYIKVILQYRLSQTKAMTNWLNELLGEGKS